MTFATTRAKHVAVVTIVHFLDIASDLWQVICFPRMERIQAVPLSLILVTAVNSGSSLVAQWLGFHAFIAMARV